MLRSCVIDIKGSWDDHLPLMNLSLTIATVPTFRWPLIKTCVGVDVDLPFSNLCSGKVQLIIERLKIA